MLRAVGFRHRPAPNRRSHREVAPLPPGVPYREQQYFALMHENGYLDIPDDDLVAVAQRISQTLT